MKSKFIMLGVLLRVVFTANAQQPFTLFSIAPRMNMQLSQVYRVFQLEDSTYRVFTRAGQIGSPVPYPPDGRYFDVSPDARQIPFHRPFPVSTQGEYLPGDYYYAGVRYDSAGTRYSKVGLFNPQLKLLWNFTTPNNDVDLKLWPVEGGQYISVKQNGRILKFNANGFVDSMGMVKSEINESSRVHHVKSGGIIYMTIITSDSDSLKLYKLSPLGDVLSILYFKSSGNYLYSPRFVLRNPIDEMMGYELSYTDYNYDSVLQQGHLFFKYVFLTDNDSVLSSLQADIDTNVNFLSRIRFNKGFCLFFSLPDPLNLPFSNGFEMIYFNDGGLKINLLNVTDSLIDANSAYKSNLGIWRLDGTKNSKDGGILIYGNVSYGFPYESLPFLIKTDTVGNVVWYDAGVGDFPTGVAEPKPVTEHLVLYPNPATTVFTIETNAAIQNIELFDITGRQIPIHVSKDIETYNVSFSSLPAGVYLLKYRNVQGENYVKKILIE